MNTPPNHPAEPREHTTVIRSEQAVASVTFAEPDDGRWFRVLNSVIDRGEWASLTGAGRNVLIVLARHAGQDGTSCPDSAALRQASGLSKSALYEALGELERKAELIRRGPGGRGWVLFPRRPFATRKPQPPSQPGVLGQSAPADSLHDLRRRRSAPADLESATADTQSAPADSPFDETETRDIVNSAPRVRPHPAAPKTSIDDDDEVSVAEAAERLIAEGGFNRKESERFLDRHGVGLAMDSLENALAEKRSGKIRKSVKAACWYFAGRGFALFDHVAKERESRVAAVAARALKGILDEHLAPEWRARVTQVFGSCRTAIAVGAATPTDVRTRDGADVARLVADAALACCGAHPSQFRRVIAEARKAGSPA